MSNAPNPPSPNPVTITLPSFLNAASIKNIAFISVVALALAAGYTSFFRKEATPANSNPFGPSPTPSGPFTPTPVVPQVTNDFLSKLYAATSSNPNAQRHCTYYAALFSTAAAQLEADGKQSAPLVTTREQMLAFVNRAGTMEQIAVPKGSYPGLGNLLAATFAASFPANGGSLTPQDRASAVSNLASMGEGFRRMAEYYKKNPPKVNPGPTF